MRHQSHVDVAFLSYQDFPISLYLNDLLFPLVSCLGTKCFMPWNKVFHTLKQRVSCFGTKSFKA